MNKVVTIKILALYFRKWLLPPSMYLESTEEKNVGAADDLRRAFHSNVSKEKCLERSKKKETFWINKTMFFVLFNVQRKHIIAH